MVVTGEKFDLKAYLAEKQSLVETALDHCLTVAYPETVYESMRYSLMAGENGCGRFSVWQRRR